MIIALNNKCNLSKEEFLSYQQELKNIKSPHQLILCPTTLYINCFDIKNISLGSQNVSSFDNGAHTGEISASQLAAAKVDYCIVGHSERRQDQQETDKDVNQKLKQLLPQNITPILCIGETKEERNQKKALEKITSQLKNATLGISLEEQKKIIFAYEPIWSIGTGNIPTNEEVIEMFTHIKSQYPHNKVIYGGSANETNIETLKKIKEIDGYLLGGLSLKPKNLQTFLKKIEN